MKKQGVPESDPEFVKARSVLTTVQRRTEVYKKQQAHRMQMEQAMAQQQQQPNGDAAAPQAPLNGASASASADDSSQVQSAAITTNGVPQNALSSGQATTTPVQVDGGSEQVFTMEQKNTLRAQMTAFAML